MSITSIEAYDVTILHQNHPRVRAEDWRSPLVSRLLESAVYEDGRREIIDSYRAPNGDLKESRIVLHWADLKDDFDKCVNTYQGPVVTEFAALGLACVLVANRCGLQITEVTRRGERVDYWLGDREFLLEVSGCVDCDVAALCDDKAENQLQKNPFGRGGYVCATDFKSGSARLWFYNV
jgi:hypothetical protein